LTPRLISDNGPQFVAKDFKEFIRVAGMSHVRTSPHYPQSNGKLERWHRTLKGDCIRVGGTTRRASDPVILPAAARRRARRCGAVRAGGHPVTQTRPGLRARP
jgi:transposase InsO family protein